MVGVFGDRHEPIGRRYDELASRPRPSGEGGEEGDRIVEVLDHLEAENEVEALHHVVEAREILGAILEPRLRVAGSRDRDRLRAVDADHARGDLRQHGGAVPLAATRVEHRSLHCARVRPTIGCQVALEVDGEVVSYPRKALARERHGARLSREPRVSSRMAETRAAALSQSNSDAMRSAAAPSRARNAGSPSTRARACARAATSPGGTRSPVSPSRTASRSPGASVVTAGVPHAAASSTVRPHPSFSEAEAITCEVWRRRTFSSSLTKPRSSTRSPMPRAMTRARTASVPVPVPATTRRTPGSSAMASTSSSIRLYGSTRPSASTVGTEASDCAPGW